MMRTLAKDTVVNSSKAPSKLTGVAPPLLDYAAQRLKMLCTAARFGGHTQGVVETFRSLLSPLGDMTVGRPTKWVSDVSDDNTPVEFSVAITDGRAEVRVLFEPQADEPTLPAYRSTALALHERLEREFGADLERFRAIQDLFLPEDMQGPFALWSSVVFSAGRAPSFKAYFNVQARGPERARSLVEEALRRLGVGAAWAKFNSTALRRGPELDELKYFALDLTADPEARVKAYVRHHAANPDELETASSAAVDYVPGDVSEFSRTMRGSSDRLLARAPFTCSSFIGEQYDCPASTTVYIPVCAYAHDDVMVRRRIHDYLMNNCIDPSLYDSIIDGFANRPLDAGVGMQAWTAFRRYRGSTRLTVYLATEANRVHPPGTVPAPTPERSAALAASTDPDAIGSTDPGGTSCDE